MAIIICAPLGAILMNSFGEKLLTNDNLEILEMQTLQGFKKADDPEKKIVDQEKAKSKSLKNQEYEL
jgi:hypothetical protein